MILAVIADIVRKKVNGSRELCRSLPLNFTKKRLVLSKSGLNQTDNFISLYSADIPTNSNYNCPPPPPRKIFFQKTGKRRYESLIFFSQKTVVRNQLFFFEFSSYINNLFIYFFATFWSLVFRLVVFLQ